MKFIFSILFIFLSSVSFSKTITTQTNGYVESVEVLKKYVTQNIPKREKVCEIKRVPVQKASQGFGADNLIGALIGPLYSTIADKNFFLAFGKVL